MRRGAAFFFLIVFAGSARGQRLTADEQAAALTRLREYGRSYSASLPNYTCIQTTQQTMSTFGGGTGIIPGISVHTDVIEEQISFVDGREIRTVTKINDQPPRAPDGGQRGPVSRGEFGNLLNTIVSPQSGADIRWKRTETLDGRRVNVFEFRVPRASGYVLVGLRGEVRAPFEGSVYADRQTGAVVQIELKLTGIPPGSGYRALHLTLDYRPAKIAGGEHLLPGGFLLQYETQKNIARVGAEFSSCRQFSVDATVTFGDDPRAAAAADPVAPDPAAVNSAAVNPVVTGIPKSALSEPPPPLAPVAEAKAIIPDKPAAATPSPATAAAPEPVFRASTQLVQVSVIAQDKTGKPVTDLRRDEFQIFDNAAPQEIRLFLADVAGPSTAAPQAAGTFTNRLGGGGASVILFDKLSADGDSDFTHNVHARQAAIDAMNATPPGERIAVYALWCNLLVVREFTSDRNSLLEKLNAFTPGFAPCVDPNTQTDVRGFEIDCPVTCRPDDPKSANPRRDDAAAEMRTHQREDFAAIAFRRQLELREEEFRIMADHLAGIPGRKNLIWVTSQFVISPASLKRLVDANVAVYPVDALGSYIGMEAGKKERYRELRAFAEVSGGVAFYDRDDLDAGVREAVRDGRVSYTLGFYPASEDAAPAAHQLRVRVSRPGVTLRYRTSYEMKPPAPPSASPVAELVEALNRPVDATVIPITANATRDGDRVNVSVSIDVPSLDLELSDGLWKGKAELVMRFATADGRPAGDASAETLTFSFRPATYESMLKSDAPYRRESELAIPPMAAEVKVLVGNLASGKIGTLTIPLAGLAPSEAKTK